MWSGRSSPGRITAGSSKIGSSKPSPGMELILRSVARRAARAPGWKNRRVAIDFEAEGLLKGARGRAREARRELLAELAEDGVPLEELRRAVEEDRLVLLPVERLLSGGGERLNAEEVAERAGVDLELIPWLRQALGLPMPESEERAFTQEDVDAAARIKAQLEAGLPAEGMLEVSRVFGIAISQVAAASRVL